MSKLCDSASVKVDFIQHQNHDTKAEMACALPDTQIMACEY